MPHTRPPVAAAPAPCRELAFSGSDAWQAGLQRHLLPLQCTAADPLAFHGQLAVAHLRGNAVAELHVDATRMVHREAVVDACGNARFLVLWQLAGRCHIHQGRQGTGGAQLDAGNWTVCDAEQAYRLDCEQGARCLLYLVPRAQCGEWLDTPDTLAASAMAARGPAHVVRSMLGAVLRERADIDERSERALHDAVITLLGSALAVQRQARGLGTGPRQPVAFSQVQAYVLNHLSDTALTVERVAAVFGLSRRTLYNLFAPAGVSPHTFIQRAKLERATVLLSDPAWRHAPIARIAAHCGFADAAHFSRVFHARHGSAPTSWRGQFG